MSAGGAPEDGLAARQPPPARTPIAVLVCSDGEHRARSGHSTGGRTGDVAAAIAALLHRRCPQVQVALVPRLCSAPRQLPALLGSVPPERLVIGCPHGEPARAALTASLRAAGLSAAYAHVVCLPSLSRPDTVAAAELSAAIVTSALARVQAAQPGAPVRERTARGARPLSRRSLFRLADQVREPVACWDSSRCVGAGRCRSCMLACPHGALRQDRGRIEVSEADCTGCGACLPACWPGAMTLGGSSLQPIEAAATDLVRSARRLAPGITRGIVLACANAGTADLVNDRQLPLEVPSLEMVTVGWLLQMLRAGVPVALAGCADAACGGRQQELAGLYRALGKHAGVPLRPSPDQACAWYPEIEPGGLTDGAEAERVTLREPAATVTGLRTLLEQARLPAGPASLPGQLPDDRSPAPPPPPADRRDVATALGNALAVTLLAGSAAPPLGAVELAASACSSCGNCLRACASGALCMDPGAGLTFDPVLCSGCGACVAMCPEGALALRPVADLAALARGRQPVGLVAPPRQCMTCGQPLAAGVAESVLVNRLARSFPAIAARLRDGDRCADCLLLVS